jgi:HlyD family secretion protein
VASAQAQLDQAQVALKMAKLQVSYTTVTSPIDGVVASIASKAGENAVPGSTLAIVSNPTSLTVTIFVPESEIGQVKIGQQGTLTTDSVAKTYHGEVVFIATQAEFTPASIETKDQRVKLVYQVKLRITDADASLKPGMPADVVL